MLLFFIQKVVAAGLPREAVAMLTGAASPKLMLKKLKLKAMQKNPHTLQWMREIDEAHVNPWLHCLTASTDLEHAIGPLYTGLARGTHEPPSSIWGHRNAVP